MSATRKILIIIVLLNTACVRLDPEVIQAGGNDYNIAMQSTQNEQMLLNLVRMKYRDTPFFLEPGSVSSQFSLSSGAGASASLDTRPIRDSIGLNGQINFAEEPTVTYLPLSGNDFVQRMLVPVSLDTILLLVNSGWSLERVLRLTVERINGIPNAPRASGPTPAEAPEYEAFLELVSAMEQLRKQDRIRYAYRQSGEEKQAVMILDNSDGQSPAVSGVMEKLGLDSGRNEFKLMAGTSVKDRQDVIVLSTRSLQGILYYLSHAVEVPETDKLRGTVTRTYSSDGSEFDWSRLTDGLFRINNGTPGTSLASVQTTYRGQRFYIDDSDLDSKSTFSLLLQLFSLQAGKGEGIAPVLTIPIGR